MPPSALVGAAYVLMLYRLWWALLASVVLVAIATALECPEPGAVGCIRWPTTAPAGPIQVDDSRLVPVPVICCCGRTSRRPGGWRSRWEPWPLRDRSRSDSFSATSCDGSPLATTDATTCSDGRRTGWLQPAHPLAGATAPLRSPRNRQRDRVHARTCWPSPARRCPSSFDCFRTPSWSSWSAVPSRSDARIPGCA